MSPEAKKGFGGIVDKFFAEFDTHTLPHEKEWCLRRHVEKDQEKMLGNDKVQALMVNSIVDLNLENVKNPDAEVKDTFVKYIVEDLVPQIPENKRRFIFEVFRSIHINSKNPKINYIQKKLASLTKRS